MQMFHTLSCASLVSVLLLPSGLGAVIDVANSPPLSSRSTATDPDVIYPNAGNASALNAPDPSVMTNLLRGSNRIKQDFEGAYLAYIEAQNPLGSQGVPREKPEWLTDIRMTFETVDIPFRGEIKSVGSNWGRWGEPTLDQSPWPPGRIGLPFDIPNLRTPLPVAISVINAKKYPGNLIRYYINTTGKETLVSYKFHIGEWLITVDAISGKISHAVRWKPNFEIGDGLTDESAGNSTIIASS